MPGASRLIHVKGFFSLPFQGMLQALLSIHCVLALNIGGKTVKTPTYHPPVNKKLNMKGTGAQTVTFPHDSPKTAPSRRKSLGGEDSGKPESSASVDKKRRHSFSFVGPQSGFLVKDAQSTKSDVVDAPPPPPTATTDSFLAQPQLFEGLSHQCRVVAGREVHVDEPLDSDGPCDKFIDVTGTTVSEKADVWEVNSGGKTHSIPCHCLQIDQDLATELTSSDGELKSEWRVDQKKEDEILDRLSSFECAAATEAQNAADAFRKDDWKHAKEEALRRSELRSLSEETSLLSGMKSHSESVFENLRKASLKIQADLALAVSRCLPGNSLPSEKELLLLTTPSDESREVIQKVFEAVKVVEKVGLCQFPGEGTSAEPECNFELVERHLSILKNSKIQKTYDSEIKAMNDKVQKLSSLNCAAAENLKTLAKQFLAAKPKDKEIPPNPESRAKLALEKLVKAAREIQLNLATAVSACIEAERKLLKDKVEKCDLGKDSDGKLKTEKEELLNEIAGDTGNLYPLREKVDAWSLACAVEKPKPLGKLQQISEKIKTVWKNLKPATQAGVAVGALSFLAAKFTGHRTGNAAKKGFLGFLAGTLAGKLKK